MEILTKGNLQFLTSEKIDVPHGFTLRHGGVSKGAFSELNLGLRRGDDPFNAIKNIELCADALELKKENLTLTYQLHTSTVKLVEEKDINKGIFREWTEGVDGIITKEKNVPLLCYSADCVPTLLYDKKGGIIGAVHGGWRGTKEKIIKNAVELMVKAGSERENIFAFIGPAIGICCYEVSTDVGEAFYEEYPNAVIKKNDEKYMVDLKEITALQLEEAGVRSDMIENSHICTMCENKNFFSHRGGEGKSGLLGGFIQLV